MNQTVNIHRATRIVLEPIKLVDPDRDLGYSRDLVITGPGEFPNDSRLVLILFSDDPAVLDFCPTVAVRIAGPDASDLADLEVPPLSEVDPEAVFPCAGDLPRIGTDATKHDVRGACR